MPKNLPHRQPSYLDNLITEKGTEENVYWNGNCIL